MNLTGLHVCGMGTPGGAAAARVWGDDDSGLWPEELLVCCAGSAMQGPRNCGCWEPIYNVAQRDERGPFAVAARDEMCQDCAYRADSPERARGEGRLLEDQARTGDAVFFCHQGMRWPVAWVHPLGFEVRGSHDDYQPAFRSGRVDGELVAAVPLKADGTCGDVCAGWTLYRRTQARWEQANA